MTDPRLAGYDSAEAMADALADRIAGNLAHALEAGGRAGLIVAGGSTPGPVYARLSARDLDWARVTVTLTDDRRVPPDHDKSNARLLRETLLQGPAAAAAFLPLTAGVAHGAAEAAAANALLGDFPWPAAATLVGMGGDGHIASLFPGAAALPAGLDPAGGERAIAMRPDPLPADAPFERISLTLPALCDSADVCLMIRGAGKRDVLGRALAGADACDLPVSALLQRSQVPLSIHWSP